MLQQRLPLLLHHTPLILRIPLREARRMPLRLELRAFGRHLVHSLLPLLRHSLHRLKEPFPVLCDLVLVLQQGDA